jgi:hypothetical protein
MKFAVRFSASTAIPWSLKMTRFSVAVSASVLFIAFSSAQEKPAAKDGKAQIAADLDKAKKAYTETVQNAKDALLSAFEPQEKVITDNKKLKIEERLQQVETLREEKTAFKADGALPKSTVMKSALSEYKTQLAIAHRICERAFDSASQKLITTDIDAAKALADEKTVFLKPTTQIEAQQDPKDGRKLWRFLKEHGNGYFKLTINGKWEEIGRNGEKVATWSEVERTNEYVELLDEKRGYITRLGAKKAWMASTKDKQFNPSPNGDWAKK